MVKIEVTCIWIVYKCFWPYLNQFLTIFIIQGLKLGKYVHEYGPTCDRMKDQLQVV